jgi:hypothetical protein
MKNEQASFNVLTTLFISSLKHAPQKFNRNKHPHSLNYVRLFHISQMSPCLVLTAPIATSAASAEKQAFRTTEVHFIYESA